MARLLRPENVIDHWSGWSKELRSRPVILNELSGGRSNRSFLLQSDIGKLVLRINNRDSLLPGESRDNEFRIWLEAGKQGIAPPLVFVESNSQYQVSTYINGDLPSQPNLNPACVDQAFKLLNQCHQLNIAVPTINYLDHIEHYWQIIESGDSSPGSNLINQRKPMQSLLGSLLASDTPIGLCHHDPVTANFVGTPHRLYLIDWEYAANGLQIMDYAALATEWKLDDAVILERTNFEAGLFEKARALYQYFCLIWENAISQASHG